MEPSQSEPVFIARAIEHTCPPQLWTRDSTKNNNTQIEEMQPATHNNNSNNNNDDDDDFVQNDIELEVSEHVDNNALALLMKEMKENRTIEETNSTKDTDKNAANMLQKRL